MWIYIINFILICFYGLGNKNRKFVIAVSALQLFLILALRNPLLGVDNSVYMSGYEYISTLSFKDMISRLHFIRTADLVPPFSFESGYVVLNWIASFLGIGFHGFLIFHAAICIFCIAKYVNGYSKNPSLSFIMYTSFGFFTYQFGILRQTLALSLFVYSISFITEHKPVRYFLMCLMAFTIHRIALITVPIYFLCNITITKRRYVFFILALLAFLIISPVLVSYISYFLETVFNKNFNMDSASLNSQIVILTLCAGMIALFACFEKEKNKLEKDKNNLLYWLFLWTIAIEIIGLYNDILARAMYIPYIAIIALIPNVLENYKSKKLVMVGRMVLVVFSFLFMVLQLKNDFINPYVFFFRNIIER